MNTKLHFGLGLCALLITMLCARFAQAEAAKPAAAPGDPYTLDTCPVTGEKLGGMGDPVVEVIGGREVRFCCQGCVAKYEAKQAEYEKKVDEAIIAQQKPYYPLDTCLVSGKKLGDMGAAVDYVYKNRLIRFCCQGCIAKFEADPAKYLDTLNKAVIEKQQAAYPLTKCPVSGDAFGGSMGEPVNLVIGNRLVKVCCKDCIADVKKNPQKYLQMLDAGKKSAAPAPKAK